MIKFKKLLENFEAQKNGQVKSENYTDSNAPLTKDEKKILVGAMENYNSYRDQLKADSIRECAYKINKAISLAERYITSECNEWMQADMAKRDIKEIKKLSDKMLAEVAKLKGVEEDIEMLYEDIGMRLDRYFDIK